MITDVGKAERRNLCMVNVENVVQFTVNAVSCVTQNINVYPDTV